MLKLQIQAQLVTIVSELYAVELKASDINVDFPTVEGHGDYTTNIAMVLIKSLPKESKQPPLDIANKIANKLSEVDNHDNYEKVEAVAPGFINITLSLAALDSFIGTSLDSQLETIKQLYHDDEKFLIEYVGPNTNKPLHIGHLRNASLGHSLLNMSKVIGKNVFAANINNDRGIHIIKSMYAYLMYGKKDQNRPLEKFVNYKEALAEWKKDNNAWQTPEAQNMKPDHFIGYYYILGNTDYEVAEKLAETSMNNDPQAAHNQMQQMLQDWENNESDIRTLWENNNKWFYEGMHQTLRNFNIYSPNDPDKFFDKEWYESEIYKSGKDVILEKIGNGIISEFDDGHVEAVLEKYKLPNIVLLRKNKTSLYIVQDIEMLRERIKDYHMDKVMYLTAAEQNLRFQQLFAIGESLGFGTLDQMIHLGYGMVRTPEGKMSSRKGTVILADELISEVEEKAIEKINEQHDDYTQEEKEKISRQVAIAAIKYGILKYNALSNIVFDSESSISFEGDTGPYLQYTFARTASIVRKYNEKFPGLEPISNYLNLSDKLSVQEEDLLRHLYKFPETIVKAAQQYSPNYLCEYLFNLSQKFNFFYTTKPILNEENTSIRELRMLITLKTNAIIKKGLLLLGIEAPEKM
ncbi:MAG: arginine--tRNA ligase [bacterium]|nr:arginine--tRNA ligase [bacterium]